MNDAPAPGRRADRRRRPRSPRPPRAGAVLAALAVLAGAAGMIAVTPGRPAPTDPAAGDAGAVGRAVDDTTVACPGAVAPAGTRTSYAVGLAAVPDLGDDGTLETRPSQADELGRGHLTDVASPPRSGLVVHGTGGLARGLFAVRADVGPTVAVTQCTAPRASWWFTGAGAALDHQSVLTLANVDHGPAVVDVRVLSPDGEIDVSDSGGRGITLAAGERRTVPLVDLAPQSDDLAIWVRTRRGRVVAAVADRYAETPADAPAQEWLPSQVAPARALRLTGMPPATGRVLVVANPSPREALVSIELAGPNGRFVPADVPETFVSPGAVATVDLSEALPRATVAARIRSSVRVVGTIRSIGQDGDVVYAGAAPRLRGPAALPSIGPSVVALTAGDETSRAEVTGFGGQGRPLGSETMSLGARTTATWRVPRGTAYVVVTPVTGTLSGSVLYAGAAVPLRDLPINIRVPAVHPLG